MAGLNTYLGVSFIWCSHCVGTWFFLASFVPCCFLPLVVSQLLFNYYICAVYKNLPNSFLFFTITKLLLFFIFLLFWHSISFLAYLFFFSMKELFKTTNIQTAEQSIFFLGSMFLWSFYIFFPNTLSKAFSRSTVTMNVLTLVFSIICFIVKI